MSSVHFPQPTSTFLTASSERQYSSVASLDCAGAEGGGGGSRQPEDKNQTQPVIHQRGRRRWLFLEALKMFQVKEAKPKGVVVSSIFKGKRRQTLNRNNKTGLDFN